MMTMRIVPAVVAISLGLAGCFTSDEPLIGDDDAVAPYARITFTRKAPYQEGSDVRKVLIREGNAYTAEGEAGAMRFAPVGDDLYVVQVTGDSEGEQLYALIAVDGDAGIARAYKVFAGPGDVGPGLRDCDENLICIDDLDAYVALAKAAYEAGAEPSAVYNIISVE